MDGILLKLVEDQAGAPGRWFWKLFGPVRRDFDRLYWCFADQPWLGPPAEFKEADLVSFESAGTSGVQLWRPGSLARYADKFAEEYIELWGIEPAGENPAQLATQYSLSRNREEITRQHASIRLFYTDSTCWEIYARKRDLLDRVNDGLHGKPWLETYPGDSDCRSQSFHNAGLSKLWKAVYLQRP